MSARIERLVTSGTFSLDGGTFDVDNNVWIVGDDEEVIIIDPAHDAEAVAAAVGGRKVKAILLTHGHDDHIRAVADTARAVGDPPIHLNDDDRVLWDMVYPTTGPDRSIDPGAEYAVAGVHLKALHTPGHSPGSTCFYVSETLRIPQDVLPEGASASSPVLFSGDTLFQGGPGATGRSYSSFDTIIQSIAETLFELPDRTVVLTGHGDSTTIGAESPNLQDWLDRGH
ncbi:MBL fold metallo-hydrolase [Brevibacterium senegalense]|uniref:MBL fold metallo-hydrolase n=1 Tax=Brevibacterium senegalense TaxID=1033736 RepID=UPI0002E78664|nr:MBL fold metallo-hydrolase [Brevibacterium senegalense]